jgi:hypothetical protein
MTAVGYYYRLVNVIGFNLSQSDPNERLTLYQLLKQNSSFFFCFAVFTLVTTTVNAIC